MEGERTRRIASDEVGGEGRCAECMECWDLADEWNRERERASSGAAFKSEDARRVAVGLE